MTKENKLSVVHPFSLNFLWIACASASGAVARYTLSSLIQHIPGNFPYATLLINLIGCFLAGLLFIPVFSQNKHIMIKKLIYWGFLPGFTLFATVGSEATVLLINHSFLWSMLDVLFNFLGSLLLFVIGYNITAIAFRWKH